MKRLSLVLVSCFVPVCALAKPVLFSSNQFGRVDKGYPQAMTMQREALISGMDKGAYEKVHEFEEKDRFRQLGRSVGMLDLLVSLPDGTKRNTTCTATLIGPDLLLTNYHCVPGLPGYFTAIKAQVRLGFLERINFSGDTFDVSVKPVEANSDLDASILRVTESIPTHKYPPISLKIEDARDRQSLFLLHHPLSTPLQVTRYKCKASKPAVKNNILIHRCDTLGGSSGALVLSSNTGAAVGLHHTGVLAVKPRNLATPMKTLARQMKTIRTLIRTPQPPEPNLEVCGGTAIVFSKSAKFQEGRLSGDKLKHIEDVIVGKLTSSGYCILKGDIVTNLADELGLEPSSPQLALVLGADYSLSVRVNSGKTRYEIVAKVVRAKDSRIVADVHLTNRQKIPDVNTVARKIIAGLDPLK